MKQTKQKAALVKGRGTACGGGIVKKILSIVLSLCMLFSITAGLDFSALAGTFYESENNDSYYTANAISPGDSIIGTMKSEDDVDFYKINTSSNGKLSISFNHRYVDSSYVYWKIALYYYADGEYNWLYERTIYGYSNEKVELPYVGAVKNGTYYIKVSTYWDATRGKEYTVSTSFVSSQYYEKEMNNSYYTATQMSLGNKYSGCMQSEGDSDFYKINTSSAGKLALTFHHKYVDSSYVYWNIYLYCYSDGSYTELFSRTIYGYENEKIALPYIGAVKNGTYYVKITTYWDETSGREYSISNSFEASNYYEKELNNSYYTATNISLGNKYSGTMNSENDSDFYKLNLSSGCYVDLTFSHASSSSSYVYWYVEVFNYSDGQYSSLTERRTVYGSDGSCKLLYQYLSAGTYFVKVTTYWGETAGLNYSINPAILVPPVYGFSASSRKTASLKLSWNSSSGANGYELQKYSGGSWKAMKTTSSTSYTVSGLSAGTTYKYRIRAYKSFNSKKYYSGWTVLTACTKPNAVKLKSLSSAKKNHTIKVNWSKVSGSASGYQIYWAKDKGFKKVVAKKFVSGQSKTSYTGSNFTKGKTYYVKIRAYKTVNGTKYYGDWSTVKSVKAK